MKKLILSHQNSDVQTKTARQPDTRVTSQARDKDKSIRGWCRRGGLSVDLASGASRHAGRQSTGQVQATKQRKRRAVPQKDQGTKLSKATHSY